jgi:cephalosporin hydroxylase
MDPVNQFFEERQSDIDQMINDDDFFSQSINWMERAQKYKYNYNFTWLDRPIIRYPNDIMVMQELIWEVEPDLIVETGIAHGGSIIFSASMLELIGGDGEVLGIDIDIRDHNRERIEDHCMFDRISMVEGDSVSEEVVQTAQEYADEAETVMVFLDSNHSHDHVIQELELYSELVTVGSYIMIADTFIECFPKGYFSDRPWDVGDNPMTALNEFLDGNKEFEIDERRSFKAMISEAPNGYVKKVQQSN